MPELLGLREGGLLPLSRLVGIPQQPQAQSTKEAAGDPRVLAIAQGVSAHLLRVVQGEPVLRMGVSQARLSTPKQGIPQRAVGFQRQHGVLQLLS